MSVDMEAGARCTTEQRDRWELLRALGAVLTTPPPANAGLRRALELPPESGVEHTDAFVLGLVPHAAIYLGAEGKLGGDGLDRVSGFWRALGLDAPQDADHLGVLLLLYAELGAAESDRADERGRAQLRRARTVLFHEHIGSWAGGYLTALAGLGVVAASAWAGLTRDALTAEVMTLPPPRALPAALRDAPAALATDTRDALLDGLVSPVRSGIILTQRDLAAGARRVGVGLRRGERRFALEAMLRQEPAATLGWLAGQARRWARLHAASDLAGGGGQTPASWWAARARETEATLQRCAAEL